MTCPNCGAPVEQRGGRGRPRKFCSLLCKQRDEQKRNGPARYQRWKERDALGLSHETAHG